LLLWIIVGSDNAILAILPSIPLVGGIWISNMLYEKKYVFSRGKKILWTVISLVVLIIGIASAIGVSNMIFQSALAGIAASALSIVAVWAARNMTARTKYGAETLGKILGFKNFIKTAEQSKLEMLAKEDPEYFYDVLPYAYVLGLSKVWVNNFENIPIKEPYWYQGYYMGALFTPMIFMNSMDTFSKSVATGVDAVTGGSFGSGGGFAGGGMGGGGGGSW
ncbi:MAG: DUF2207 family protein, partial [Anaerovoracaceae bacterium]